MRLAQPKLRRLLCRPGSFVLAVSAFVLAGMSASLAQAEETFPFQAFVNRDRTQLRSGPGDDHYATGELSRGTEIEVHRRVDGGWLGIRPPATSFSWVSQREIELRADSDVGEVVGSTAVSWIGSTRDSVTDHRWLVKLNPGEVVTVLGKERRRVISQGKSDVYYKIAPPAGEFRWIHEDDVVLDKEELTAMKDSKVELADFRVALRGTPRAEPTPSTTASQTVKAEPEKRDDFKSRSEESATTQSGRSNIALLPKRDATSLKSTSDKTASKSRSGNITSSDLESQLRDLEAELSLIAAQPADTWNFTSLRVSAEDLVNGAQSTIDRARVQLYLDKLAEFEGLKSRHALMTIKPEMKSSTTSLASSKTSPTGNGTSPSADPRFDGTGWLLPVHSTKQLSPPYALLDKEGNILQFVSPAPGLNLNRYLRKEIGVFGQKEQTSVLDKPHLTAHRIVELDRHRK